MKNINSLLENKNFLNNQNYIKSDFLSYKLYQEYLWLRNKNKLVQILYTSNSIFSNLVLIWFFMGFGLGVMLFLNDYVIKNDFYTTSIYLLFMFISMFIIFLGKYLDNEKLLLYLPEISIREILLYHLSYKYVIKNNNLQKVMVDDTYITGYIVFIGFSLMTIIALKDISISSSNKVLIDSILLINIVVNLLNIVNYIFMLIILKTTQFMNLISYLLNKNKLNKKVFVLKPNTYKINKILEIKDDIVYTDVAIIKKV